MTTKPNDTAPPTPERATSLTHADQAIARARGEEIVDDCQAGGPGLTMAETCERSPDAWERAVAQAKVDKARLDDLLAKDAEIARLTAERDQLRETLAPILDAAATWHYDDEPCLNDYPRAQAVLDAAEAAWLASTRATQATAMPMLSDAEAKGDAK